MTKKQKKVLIRIIIAFLLLIVLHFVPVKGWLSLVLYLVPYFVIGYDILKKAFKGILNRQVFDENFLMAVATVGAIILGEYTEGVAVMLFYQIGELFQSYAVGKSLKKLTRMKLRLEVLSLLSLAKRFLLTVLLNMEQQLLIRLPLQAKVFQEMQKRVTR